MDDQIIIMNAWKNGNEKVLVMCGEVIQGKLIFSNPNQIVEADCNDMYRR